MMMQTVFQGSRVYIEVSGETVFVWWRTLACNLSGIRTDSALRAAVEAKLKEAGI